VLTSLSLLGIWSWQIAHQVGGAAIRQGCRVGSYYYQPLRAFGCTTGLRPTASMSGVSTRFATPTISES
jgi:hypothetical protein